MTEVTIHGQKIRTKEDLFAAFGAQMTLPAHCGRTLDALADVITEATPIAVTIVCPGAFSLNLGDWGVSCLEMLETIANSEHQIKLTIKEETP
ncbi:MAG: barstar family protein [Bacillota bacterium]|nr:barstar family protein [Bacillota bacterium]